MKNTLYSGEIYNEQVKNDYLKKYKKNTQKSLSRIFKASYLSELDLNKDLCLFNREELRGFFYLLRPLKTNSSKQNGQLVKNYINWCISKGYKTGLNPLDSVPTDWFEQFVDDDHQQYFTDDELNRIVDGCENAQDAVIIQLISEGVLGEANEELLNLRRNDIDFNNNRITLRDSINSITRTIDVSENCIRLCRQALNETEYEKSNGETSPDTRSPVTKLVENEYVLKSALTNTKNLGKAEKNIVHRRLDVISRYFEISNFTPKNIHYSGMLIMAKNTFLEKGKLERQDYDFICDKFGIRNIKQEGAQYYYRIKNEFLNVEKIKEMYNI